MENKTYFNNPERALPPTVLADPATFHRLHMTEQNGGGWSQKLRDKLKEIIRKPPAERLSYAGLGGYSIETVWSDSPHKPDLYIVTQSFYSPGMEESCVSLEVP